MKDNVEPQGWQERVTTTPKLEGTQAADGLRTSLGGPLGKGSGQFIMTPGEGHGRVNCLIDQLQLAALTPRS